MAKSKNRGGGKKTATKPKVKPAISGQAPTTASQSTQRGKHGGRRLHGSFQGAIGLSPNQPTKAEENAKREADRKNGRLIWYYNAERGTWHRYASSTRRKA